MTLTSFCNYINTAYSFCFKLFFVASFVAVCAFFIRRTYFAIRNFFLTDLSVANMRVFWQCSETEKGKFLKLINELPYEMCEHFAKNNWQLNILSAKNYSKIKADGMEKETIGMFDARTRNIYINAGMEEHRMKETIYHEFGHYCDWIAGGDWFIFGSIIDPFARSLFESLRYSDSIPTYYRSDIKEFTAYCVSSYVCKPGVLTSEMLELGKKRLGVFESAKI